jgi:DNA-binding transcriptional ArsR family regulator
LQNEDPLSQLLLDAGEVDRGVLAAALSERIGIDSKSGRIVMLPGYSSLNARQKVLVILLAAKAASLLGVRDSEFMATQEVISISGLPQGTVRPKLKELREAGLVSQGTDRAYYVPSALLRRAVDQLP